MATLIRPTYPEPQMVFAGPDASLAEAPPIGEDVHPANGTDFKLQEAQQLVGGLIEVFPLDDGLLMACNEEGKLEHLPVNVEATILFRRTYGAGRYHRRRCARVQAQRLR